MALEPAGVPGRPDRSREHNALYGALFVLLLGGSILLRGNTVYETGYAWHSIMEAIATVLAFVVGALALVRYYSRKQITFLLIGCGFLGAALLDLNHALRTSEWYVEVLRDINPGLSIANVFSWSWTAERMFLSLFLFGSLVTWGQEGRDEGEEESAEPTEIWVYVSALLMTLMSLIFFESVPQRPMTRPGLWIHRPGELLPAVLFLVPLVGFYRNGGWRRDLFEHWMVVSLLLTVLAHAAFMAFSQARFDAMHDAAHLLKITSYVALLTGLLTSVYETFRREEEVLGALTRSNEALEHEIGVRARTEAAVKESSRRLQSFLDNANDLIQSTAPDGRILYVNSAWKRVLGYTDDELSDLNLFHIVEVEGREALQREFDRVRSGAAPRRFGVNYVAADGRVVILSGSAQALVEEGRAVSTQSILRDVTEQRMAELRLEESQQKLEALVENTGDSIWSVDRDHRLITLNSAFALGMEARTGAEPRLGQRPGEVFASEDVAWYRELYDKTLSGERSVELRTDVVEGRLRYFELYANPIQSLEGVSGAVFFGKDVTDRVRAEEALRVAKEEADAANKAKSDFLASMSHELRTPLNSVIGFTNILLKNKDDRLSEKDLGFLRRVLSNGTHLLALINEVLDLAKVEAGRMELIIEDIDLAALCTETVHQLEGQAKTKDGAVALVAEVPSSVAPVRTDSAKLKQVIINLVGNALKFTEKGSVTVRLDMAPDGVTPVGISVVDTGIGIAEDRLDAIFEAFQQAEAGTSRKYGGTGLGLALSRSICLLMGYDLMVESKLGEGSTFRIVMGERAPKAVRGPEPAEDAAPAAGPRAAPGMVAARAREGAPSVVREAAEPLATGRAAADASPPDGEDGHSDEDVPSVGGGVGEGPRPSWEDFKVLVVDDESDSRLLIEHFLEEFGCQVFLARSGDEGLELARRHAPDLMTIDLLMPDMDGWELLRRLKADRALRAIPVVVVSVLGGESRGRLLGAVDAIAKPFEREDLLRVLWRTLGRQRGGRVLLMVDDAPLHAQLVKEVEDHGLAVVTDTKESALDAVGRHSPDAVVLDLRLPAVGGAAVLPALRGDRLHTGIPLLAVVPDDLPAEELETVRELATVYAPPDAGRHALERLLDAVFPMPEVEEPSSPAP